MTEKKSKFAMVILAVILIIIIAGYFAFFRKPPPPTDLTGEEYIRNWLNTDNGDALPEADPKTIDDLTAE